MTTKIQTVLMTGKTHTTASHREGASRGDERVDIQMSIPGKRSKPYRDANNAQRIQASALRLQG